MGEVVFRFVIERAISSLEKRLMFAEQMRRLKRSGVHTHKQLCLRAVRGKQPLEYGLCKK